MKRVLSAVLAGFVFGIGLLVSGMTNPHRVVAFLDFAGKWNPSLAFVMVGAIAVHAVLLRMKRLREHPAISCSTLPGAGPRKVDAALVGGSAIFGVGWGLSGYCPGPAITSIGLGSVTVIAFVLAMIAGSLLADRVATPRAPTVPKSERTNHFSASGEPASD